MEKHTVTLLLFFKKGKPFFVSSQKMLAKDTDKSSLPEPVLRLWKRILGFHRKFKENFDPQENVCSTLRHADRIILVHPESITEVESKDIFTKFLNRSGKKHGVWMVINTILALMGGILTPIPGPNLFFFYPAARAVSHYFARKGVNTAQELDRKDFTTNSLLDTIQRNITDLETMGAEIKKLEEVFMCSHVQRLLS
jgi:Mitochondrial K+-H+ exchange-related